MTVKATKAGLVIPHELLGEFDEFERAEVVRGTGKIVVLLKVKRVRLGKEPLQKRLRPKFEVDI